MRGLGFSVGHDDYTGGDVVAKMREANERTLVIALIETAEGIANADEILRVPGIDVGWLGHYDLTNTMGITAQFEHPDFLAAVDAPHRGGDAPRQGRRVPRDIAGDGGTVARPRLPLSRLRHGYRAFGDGVGRRAREAARPLTVTDIGALSAGHRGSGEAKAAWGKRDE